MPASEWAKIISSSVVPVVIISACGLLCLAFYNRLAAIVSRLRGFQRERLREQELLDRAGGADEQEYSRRRKLLELLEEQSVRVVRRAKLIRVTLLFLLLTISELIVCCIMLGISVLASQTIFVAIALFMLGLLTLLAGIISAMFELKAALEPAELESHFVSDMVQEAHRADEAP
jgi:hypothetical protein